MKTSQFASILIFALFYTTLLSTMVVTPLVLASRHTAGMATVHGDAQVRERFTVNPRRELRLPRSDESVSMPTARQLPSYRSGPDAAMIKPGKARAKAIKA